MPATSSATDQESAEQALSVTQLTAHLKGVVEQEFGNVWVAGEISNFSRPQSGHCYFTLKDDKAAPRGHLAGGSVTSQVRYS